VGMLSCRRQLSRRCIRQDDLKTIWRDQMRRDVEQEYWMNWNLNLLLSCADSLTLSFPLRGMHRPSILSIARNHQGKGLI
jgi:hypothetical protein